MMTFKTDFGIGTDCVVILSYPYFKDHTYSVLTFEPQHEKTYLLTRVLNKDSDQTVHVHSLIRVFVLCIKKLCILGYSKCAQ